MSVQIHSRTISSPDVKQLIRNMMILPVVRSNFECDKRVFEKSKLYEYRSPYAAVAQRAITRIDADVAKIGSIFRTIGLRLGEEEGDPAWITRVADYRGERHAFALRWGTFEGELELLTDYYLGNLSARDDDR
ncbi:hypothetical protein FE783_21300 [Paenibacillus mesophilus]|uniref:hypothetical protein n=1 Tax=Paenibacillus mesophilus TaxID=2582849 RepID=UPI00110F5A99|nr:hypothetical protein [Paenibacillus mesophilus]TMV47538.1 hypothetical protein FE783_21300 [Paenibacillus mesophilus]